jgi:hypothetical protein
MKIEGEIANFGLQEWWLNELTTDEQNTILPVFQPPIGFGENSLIEGNFYGSSETPMGFLSGLSVWFKKPEHREIGYKIIKQAEKLRSGKNKIMDLHFLYQAKMQIYYRNRDYDDFALPLAIEACEQQIAISKHAKQAFLREFD